MDYDLDNRIIKVDIDNNDVEKYRRLVGILDLESEANVARRVKAREASLNQCAEHKHQAGQTVIQNDIMAHPSRLNSVIARAVDGSKFKLEWYHKNYLDHVYAVSDDDGDILEHYRYTAFGEVSIYNSNGNQVSTTQIDNHILWNTRRRDEVTGYYMYKFRHYSAELGRWPSRDPIEERGGVNLYGFARNEPLRHWDRLGLVECSVNCGGKLIGKLVSSEIEFHHSLNKKIPEGKNANGISIVIHFKDAGDFEYEKEPCCCDGINFIQVVVTNDNLFNGKNGGIDNLGRKDTPFYDIATGWDVKHGDKDLYPAYPDNHEDIIMGDRPYLSDELLNKHKIKKATVTFYTFVVCVKDDGQDSILTSGMKWGYTRTKANGIWSEPTVIEPSCIGAKNFPKADKKSIQDYIDKDTNLGGDPKKGGYNFNDEWKWDIQ